VVGVLDVDTPHGPARVHLHAVDEPAGALVLGHGAGGGVAARDLVAATKGRAGPRGSASRSVEQPYRVAGRRSPAPAGQLDAAWVAVVEHLRGGALGDLSLVVGGRSSGARVACRTAAQTGAAGVLCLAFPVHPPGARRRRACPSSTPWPCPPSSVQGAGDPFGMPPAGARREVVTVPGNHSLTGDLETLRAAVGRFLGEVLGLAH
jgi:predicted alpha/beta-hydrolase family hydrolase